MNDNLVDLGLSVKWSTCNIGATKPNEFGDYFAWGETEPKDSYLLENYKLCVKVDSWIDVEYSKYNVEPGPKDKSVIIKGKIDNLKKLELDDDAAHKVLGGKWRMPTIEEFMELRNKCKWDWTTIDKINGYIVSGKKPGFKDNFIFIPAAGYRSSSSYQNIGTHGYYWSRSVNDKNSNTALYFSFNTERDGVYASSRSYGLTIRPVSE